MAIRYKGWIKGALNAMLAPAGLWVAGRDSVPRGAFASLRKARAKGFTPGVIFDVGAAHGAWTRECLGVFPRARYLLVEALGTHEPALHRLSQAHPGAVRYWMGAAGAEPGETTIHVHGDQSSVLASEFSAKDGTVHETVRVDTIDALTRAHALGAPDLLKIDIQGFEIAALDGAAAVLPEVTALLLEVSFREIYEGSPLAHEVIAYAAARGFRIYDVCTYRPRPHDRELAQADILFVRADSALFDYEGWS